MAVVTKPEPTTLATTDRPPVVALLDSASARAIIEPMLPAGVEYRRVLQEVYLAGRDNPEILECTPESIIRAVARAESWGLTIGDTVHLVPFNVKVSRRGEQDRWEKRLKAVQDYKGKIELIVGAGVARAVIAECVYEHEFFEMELGSHPVVRHRPERSAEARGALVGAYAIAQLRFQTFVAKWMPLAEIDAIRQKHSKSWKDGPVPPWYCRKTVVHQLAKMLPKNPRLAQVLRKFEEEELDLEEELGEPVATVEAPVAAASVSEPAPPAEAPAAAAPAGESAAPAEESPVATEYQVAKILELCDHVAIPEELAESIKRRLGRGLTTARADQILVGLETAIQKATPKPVPAPPAPAAAVADESARIHAASLRLTALLKSDGIAADARARVADRIQQSEPTLQSIEAAIAELEDAELPF